MIILSFVAILVLCLTHIFVEKLRLTNIPRSKWLSVAGGISVTYIFLQSFPELKEFQEKLIESGVLTIPGFEHHEIYLISLAGLVFFYGLENKTKKSTISSREAGGVEEEEEEVPGVFWIHIASFALYNFIIGYLILSREEKSVAAVLLYAVAMAFHFMVTDHSLEDHFRNLYRRKGRWILIGLLFLGWLTSIFFTIPEEYLGILFAFLAGGIIMNVLKEELPKERESNFMAFFAGIVFYTIILMLI